MAVIPAQTGTCVFLVWWNPLARWPLERNKWCLQLSFLRCSLVGRQRWLLHINDTTFPSTWSHACSAVPGYEVMACCPHAMCSSHVCTDSCRGSRWTCYLQLCSEGRNSIKLSMGSARKPWNLKYGNGGEAVHRSWFTILPCTYMYPIRNKLYSLIEIFISVIYHCFSIEMSKLVQPVINFTLSFAFVGTSVW